MYGLGATLYALLTGSTPIDALSRVIGSLSAGVDPLKPANLLNPAVPRAVDEALKRAMASSSADRFETVEEFWQVLMAHGSQQIPHATSIDLSQPFPPEQVIEDSGAESLQREQFAPHTKKREALRIFAGLLIILAIGIACFSYLRSFTVLLLCCLGALLLLFGVLLHDLSSQARTSRKNPESAQGNKKK